MSSYSPDPLSGRLITFEGIDGAGKSTHLEWFAQRLRDAGHTVRITREPGGTPLAEALRELMLHTPMGAGSELLLAFAARADHVEQVLRPALAAGTWVLCDRFTDSTFAYQGGGRSVDWALIEALEAGVIAGLQPDLTVWFDIRAQVAADRRVARDIDRFESQRPAFFERVRDAYRRRAMAYPERFVRIDGECGIEAVRAQLERVLAGLT
jgi:dTMP kinase